MDDIGSIVLVASLARVWSAIRKHHPAVPSVVLLPAPNPHRQTNVLGHFAPLRWSARKDGGGTAAIHEVVVVAEHLNRAPEEIVETLLHEAAHAMNFQQGIKDCSQSQYHNQRFKAAAEELGLVVEQVPHYGFAFTRLKPETTARYVDETAALSAVLIHRRPMALLPAAPPTIPGDGAAADGGGEEDNPDNSKGRLRKATCKCPFIIRASRKVLAATTISCGRCGGSFELA